MGKLEFMALDGRIKSGHDEDECFSYKNDERIRYVSAYALLYGVSYVLGS
jgi:hypothetical protein